MSESTTARQARPTGMLERIQGQILAGLEESVAWFNAQMPGYYFKVTGAAEQARHLEVIHALRRAAEARLTMIDDGEAGKLLFFGRPSTHSLLDVIEMLGEKPFHRVELHTSRDGALFIYAFAYGSSKVPAGFDLAAHRQAILAASVREGADGVPAALAGRYLDAVDQGYLASSAVERVERHLRAWSRLADGSAIHVAADRPADSRPATRLLVAAGSAQPYQFLVNLARVVKRHHLTLERGYVDWVPAIDGGERVLISSLYVTSASGGPLARRAEAAVLDDLASLRRLFNDGLASLYLDGSCTLQELELLRAALGFVGQMMAPDHPYLDVGELGEEAVRAEPALCRELCDLLAARFDPARLRAWGSWERAYNKLLARAHACEPLIHATILEGMLSFIGAVRLTNLYRPQRLGLAFKVDPAVLPAARFVQRPYGMFYFFSPQGRGFHVRFRASARGGLRLVLPRNAGQYQRARDGLLKEVYDLAWAQQLKNKDIPEGGSKCIALVEPGGDPSAVVKQVVDPLIDLILPPELVPEVIGPHGDLRESDLIFLGPDENMTPERIGWVATRARDRGLPHYLTLMSSKPGSGINHKEYGVTSEGIFRWISLVLPLAGITDPRARYTVKMTGGPDGDVGGNLLRILHREHGERCRVVAISDGTGYAHDPEGLAWPELLRLVKASLGISAFDPARLSGPTAKVGAVSDKTSEQQRNALHNVVPADLFLPCGGRPYTINDQNWKEFLRADGRPSAKVMVEGANIFLTPHARRHLEDAGLVVIKDSSANKGGVICSSYEVLAGLVMSEEEFMARKARYAAEVIELLCQRAEAEGKALIAAWKRRGKGAKLSELSQQFSEEINRVSGLLETVIDRYLDSPEFMPAWTRHLHGHCPPSLVAEFAERLPVRIPRAHRVAILSKRLASTMVYREGLTWCRAYLQEDRLREVLATYLKAEDYMRTVIDAIAPLNLPNLQDLIHIVEAGSQRELVRQRLGQDA